ncbi:MAG TPA: 6-bladed beta-propeller [Terriglobia bacterium]|nr:6-bladed beta-propeller [Terriglobia bacterium]
MVQLLLKPAKLLQREWFSAGALALLLMWMPAHAAAPKGRKPHEFKVPVLLLQGGRKLAFERSFASEGEVRPQKKFWSRVLNIVAGEAPVHSLIRPYDVVTDSRGRIIVTDPGAAGVHIFDFNQQKYKFITRREKSKDPMLAPQCVALDAQDNIYVTDSETGKIFVFAPSGKFSRAIGSLKYGEGYFKRPTGIAVDSAAGRIYVTDTLRDQIFMLDMQGSVLAKIGKRGAGRGEFNFPTELRLDGPHLVVVDAMNFRIQVLDRSGAFQYQVGKMGDVLGSFFRPKGLGIDSEGHLYVVDGFSDLVQVFNREGQLLYYFGGKGTGFGDFQLPAGLFIDHEDRVYVVDSLNRRVQVFRYFGVVPASVGGAK